MKKGLAAVAALVLWLSFPGTAMAEPIDPPRVEPTAPVAEAPGDQPASNEAVDKPASETPAGEATPGESPTVAPDTTATILGGHKPGKGDFRERISSDLKLPNGAPHPCAGRNLIYRTHVDAVYATRNTSGALAIMTVSGDKVIDSDTVCMRVGPDAIPDGREVSRFVVPNDPYLAFLGKPGKIVWTAPQENYGRRQPIWAGMGAFDEAHELRVPDRREIPSGGVMVNLVGFEGPGHMEVFGYATGSRPRRDYSTREKRLTAEFMLGSHSHISWTFSEPGIYKTTWSADLTLASGEKQVAKPQDVYWLVGKDSDVALPEGTTKPAETITVTAEEMRDKAGLPVVEGDEVPEIEEKKAAPVLTPEDAEKQLERVYGEWAPKDIKGAGELVFSQPLPDDNDPDYAHATLDGKPIELGEYQLAIEVPDDQMRRVTKEQVGKDIAETSQGGWVWTLDNPGNSSMKLKFSTKDFDFKKKNDLPVRMSLSASSVPNDGRVTAGHWRFTDDCKAQFDPTVDTDNHLIAEEFLEPGERDISVMFNRPGAYSMSLDVFWQKQDGSNFYTSSPVTFYVGNAAINAGRKNAGRAEMLPVMADGNAAVSQPVPGKCETAPAPQPEPDPKPDPKPGATSSVPQIGKKQAAAGWATQAAGVKAVFVDGHLDLALRENLTTGFHDGAVPQSPRWLDSGELAIAVPDSTYGDTPIGKGFMLPQLQVNGVPWVGFNTEKVPYQTTGPVKVSFGKVVGPGQIVQGSSSLITGFEKKLDSNSSMSLKYPDGSHDHQNFIFTKPGLYRVDYDFVWHASAKTHTRTLTVTYLVGDGYVTAGLKALGQEVPEGLGKATPEDYPAGGDGLGGLKKPLSDSQVSPVLPGSKKASGGNTSFGRSLLASSLDDAVPTDDASSGDTDSAADSVPAPPAQRGEAASTPSVTAGPVPVSSRLWQGLALGLGSAALVAGAAGIRRRPLA